MGNRLKTTMADTETQDKLALIVSNPTDQETSESENKQDSCGKDGIAIYLISRQDKAPLDRAARNELFRKNPNLIAAAIAHTQREQAKQQGHYQYEDYTVTWDAGFVPFHFCFSVSCPRGLCHHLVSVRNRFLQEPVSYSSHDNHGYLICVGPVCKSYYTIGKIIHRAALSRFEPILILFNTLTSLREVIYHISLSYDLQPRMISRRSLK